MANAWTSPLHLKICAQPNSYSLLVFQAWCTKSSQPAFKLVAQSQHLVMPVRLHKASMETGTLHPNR